MDSLFRFLYEDLRRRARAQRRRWDGDETLDTTALVHEAYLKLAAAEDPDWENRAHFLAVACSAMRQVLIDYARFKGADKRGGGWRRLSLRELEFNRPSKVAGVHIEVLLTLEESLARLEAENPRLGRIVECRFFGGMTNHDTAAALGVSPATVKRGWTIARAWLYRDLQAGFPEETQV